MGDICNSISNIKNIFLKESVDKKRPEVPLLSYLLLKARQAQANTGAWGWGARWLIQKRQM